MRNKVITVLFYLFGFTMILATPHFPGGIPSIGPLKGGVTFWGTDADGNYIDGVTYDADYNINVPKYGEIKVKIGVTTFYSGGQKAETSISFVLDKPMDDFTGEVSINTVTGGKTTVNNYKGNSNNSRTYTYSPMFDFTGADKNSGITVDFLLNDGKKLSVKLKKETAQDWIFISQQFPESK